MSSNTTKRAKNVKWESEWKNEQSTNQKYTIKCLRRENSPIAMMHKAGIFTELSLKTVAAFYTGSVTQVKYYTIDISIPSMCKAVLSSYCHETFGN